MKQLIKELCEMNLYVDVSGRWVLAKDVDQMIAKIRQLAEILEQEEKNSDSGS